MRQRICDGFIRILDHYSGLEASLDYPFADREANWDLYSHEHGIGNWHEKDVTAADEFFCSSFRVVGIGED